MSASDVWRVLIGNEACKVPNLVFSPPALPLCLGVSGVSVRQMIRSLKFRSEIYSAPQRQGFSKSVHKNAQNISFWHINGTTTRSNLFPAGLVGDFSSWKFHDFVWICWNCDKK